VDNQIDENLRRVYSETLKQPLPERFTQLLDQLRQQNEQSDDPPEDK
jgi:hypothetical protein